FSGAAGCTTDTPHEMPVPACDALRVPLQRAPGRRLGESRGPDRSWLPPLRETREPHPPPWAPPRSLHGESLSAGSSMTVRALCGSEPVRAPSASLLLPPSPLGALASRLHYARGLFRASSLALARDEDRVPP